MVTVVCTSSVNDTTGGVSVVASQVCDDCDMYEE